jgi:hypothetical protein
MLRGGKPNYRHQQGVERKNADEVVESLSFARRLHERIAAARPARGPYATDDQEDL